MFRRLPIVLLVLVAACSSEPEPTESAEPEAALGRSPPPDAYPRGRVAKRFTKSPIYHYVLNQALADHADFRSRLDLATTRASRQGLYTVTIRERPETVELGQFQRWRLQVVDRDGRPVSGATLNLSGGMPEHGHGLPTQPKISAGPAPGSYVVEGIQFSMPGWWQISAYVSKDRREDTVTFNLLLE